MDNIPDWVGTLPGWLTAGGVFTLIAVIAKFIPDWTRSLNERRKLTIDENAAIRAEYVHEIKELREEIRLARDEAARQRRDCEAETTALRGEIRTLHEEMVGLRRHNLLMQMEMIEGAPATLVPKNIQDAVDKLKDVP